MACSPYLSPTMGFTLDSLAKPLNISWNQNCLTASELDIYLYAPDLDLPRIHVWEHVARSRGSYSAQLMPRWWNATTSQKLQIIILPAGDPPFMATAVAGPVFTATYSPSGTSPPPAADTSIVDSGVTRVNDLANQQASKKSALSGRAAAGVLVPLCFIALAFLAYIKWKRRKEHQKRKAWTEKVDKRMSTISTEWKSVSAAGAQAAIRNSIAVASRNSSFSFGPIRPNSSVDIESLDHKDPAVRTGTGVGLRNPNALSTSRNSTTSTRVSRVSFAPDPRVSRVSFAESTDSSSINRKNIPSRAFHSAYIPPVPALPEGITSVYIPDKFQDKEKERDNLSPRQTAGPLTLTPDDIKARIGASASGRPTKGSVSALDDEMLPALSLMRTGNMESETDDFLLPSAAPQIPELTYSPTTPTLTAAFPIPPTTTTKGVAAPSVVLSPDEMLRAYAERKKSLADAARAGRIGAPLRVSVVPSIAASAITSHSGSTINNNPANMSPGGPLGMGTGRVETVSSIHATGMRVAYNDGNGSGLVLPPPSLPSAYQEASPQTKAIVPLSLSGKGIEGGKSLLGKVKSMGKKRKSMNPFAKPEQGLSIAEGEEEHEADGSDNPGEAYVAALEAEAAETDAERQLNATHNLGDEVVGAYPYAYEQQDQQQRQPYYAGYEGQYYGYGYQYGEEQGEGGEYAYGNGGEEQQGGGQAYGY